MRRNQGLFLRSASRTRGSFFLASSSPAFMNSPEEIRRFHHVRHRHTSALSTWALDMDALMVAAARCVYLGSSGRAGWQGPPAAIRVGAHLNAESTGTGSLTPSVISLALCLRRR